MLCLRQTTLSEFDYNERKFDHNKLEFDCNESEFGRNDKRCERTVHDSIAASVKPHIRSNHIKSGAEHSVRAVTQAC